MKKIIDTEEIDNSILDDLIGHCEDHMSSPYKEKAKAKMVVAKVEAPEESEEMEMDDKPEHENDEMSEEDKAKLLEFYQSLKG